MDFQRHSGGWSGGYSSFAETTFDLPNNLTSYDTLEVYHEHACYERTNRYQKSDGSYGGCHEWDYLAYMYVCDRTNDSICNTEAIRWITTYGREGMWLTDISPYLFMFEDGEERRFKYAGANKGDLTRLCCLAIGEAEPVLSTPPTLSVEGNLTGRTTMNPGMSVN